MKRIVHRALGALGDSPDRALRPLGRALGRARAGRPLRLAYGRLFHEANAFSPSVTERDAFERLHHVEGEALAAGCAVLGSELPGFLPAAELSGFVAAAGLAGDVETVPLSSSFAIPSGPLSRDCFDWLLHGLVTRLLDAGPLDGVYLALHGSMQVVGLDRPPEAVVLEKVREILGSDAGVAVSYDLHANLSRGLVDPADVVIAYRTNPHRDLVQTGYRAGARLIDVLRDHTRPVHAWRKLPMVLGGGTTIDFFAPMRPLFGYLRRLEHDPRVISASLFMVHPYTTADDHGWAVHVSVDDKRADDAESLAGALADDLADRAWGVRRVPLPPMPEIGDALDEVVTARSGRLGRLGPTTLVDVADIVGAGAPGGNTRIVEELMKDDRGLSVIVPVHDPGLAAELFDAPLKSEVRVTLRGSPGYGMPEVPLAGVVISKLDAEFGKTVRLDVGRTILAVTELAPLPIHPRFWRELGVEPRAVDAMVQKNFFHYRVFYALISFHHVPVSGRGATDLGLVRARDYAVPTFPREDPPDWRPFDPRLRATPFSGGSADRAGAAPAG